MRDQVQVRIASSTVGSPVVLGQGCRWPVAFGEVVLPTFGKVCVAVGLSLERMSLERMDALTPGWLYEIPRRPLRFRRDFAPRNSPFTASVQNELW